MAQPVQDPHICSRQREWFSLLGSQGRPAVHADHLAAGRLAAVISLVAAHIASSLRGERYVHDVDLSGGMKTAISDSPGIG